jgi:hypothetical protein
MTFRRTCALLGVITLIPFSLALMGRSAIGAEETVGVTEIAPELLVFATAAGNVVASVGQDGALLVGTPDDKHHTSAISLLVGPNQQFGTWSLRRRTWRVPRVTPDGGDAGRSLLCMRTLSNA